MAGIAGLTFELAELTIEEIEELEALDEDLYAEEYEANVEDEFPEVQFPQRQPFFRRPPLREVVRGVPAATVLAEGIALPAQVKAYGGQLFGGRTTSPVPIMHRRINTGGASASTGRTTASVPYFSFANSSRARTTNMPILGKRKRKTLRSRRRRPAPRMVRPRFASTASSKLARASAARSNITVINKLLTGVTATQRETGSGITSLVRNYQSQTTPDGTFSLGWSFKLIDFPNYADYTDVYQWYKILGVKVHFYPLQNSYTALQESTATNPILQNSSNLTAFNQSCTAPSCIIAKDMQDDGLFTSETIAMQHHGAVFHCFNDGRELMIYLQPKATGLLGTAGAEAVFEQSQPQWISTASAAVPHYGLRSFWNMSDGSSVRVVMEMKVAFKLKKV
ncbi:hypothetical protein [Rheinheimera sp.]|uniref:hypothetical protein n=1 Tax=Rheinheimera sp. TaxID=1869214 RepID=UPI004048D511